ncbi:hypothetical protein BGZ46_008709, partial [Entomortierella lignicola]
MSAPYASPADGTQQQYQYVTPQQPGTPIQHTQPVDPNNVQSYYAQSSAFPQQQQPVYAPQPDQQAFSPQPVYVDPQQQQAFSPQPVYIDPNQPQPQQAYFAQPQPQPATYVVTETTSELPVVTGGDGKGLTGKMQQVDVCCFFIPLHTGAMIITFLMFIYYGYCGLALLLDGTVSGGAFVGLIIFGIIYLLIAIVSFYGLAGIYKEEPAWVDRFIKMYVIGSILWVVLEIIDMIIFVAAGYVFGWAGWVVQLIILGALQYYFCVCLVSYQRVLHARVNG